MCTNETWPRPNTAPDARARLRWGGDSGWRAGGDEIWRELPVVPMAPKRRVLLVTEAGNAVGRSTLNSAWQRAM